MKLNQIINPARSFKFSESQTFDLSTFKQNVRFCKFKIRLLLKLEYRNANCAFFV